MVQEVHSDNQAGHLFRKQYNEVKAQVPIPTYCADTGITKLKRAPSERMVGLCPYHEEKTPSFTVYIDDSFDSFYCFGCGVRGDVIDLHRFVDGHEQAWTAMRSLAERYNVELSERPERWKRRSCQKAQLREKAMDALIKTYRRRYFKLFGEHLGEIEDEAERKAESAKFYKDLYPMAYLAAMQRMERRNG